MIVSTTITSESAQTLSMAKADALRQVVGEAVTNLMIPADLTSRLSAGCHFTSLQDHAGIAVLFSLGLYAPALALLRPVFESYVRGIWLSDCAKQAQISDFANGAWQKIPSIRKMVDELENTASFGTGYLAESLLLNWQTLCGFTHTGIEQVQVHISGGSVESCCSPEQIDEALNFAGACAIMAGIALATLADNVAIATHILDKAKEFVDL